MSAPPWLMWGVLVACTLFTCSAFTVDCNTEYTDCDTELGKYATEGYDYYSTEDTTTAAQNTESTVIFLPTIPTPKNEVKAKKNDTEAVKPKGRLLNVSLEDLTSLNDSKPHEDIKKVMPDLSDVNLDDDDDDIGKGFKLSVPSNTVPDKFFTNLQAPFYPINMGPKSSDEIETCKENGVNYSVGDRLNRGCEETCVCSPAGAFECSPRCKTPYMRRGRRIDDPLCFETPIDECCSILACATGLKPPLTKQVCRYGNDTYNVGTKWSVACERVCTCEKDSVIICKPRCPALITSEKCINVQDPNDACCEVQVCDVSQDVHEEHTENSTTVATTKKIAPIDKVQDIMEIIEATTSTMRPLMLSEPIGSVKVLQNNTVQVNLIHMNTSTDPVHLMLSDDGGQTYKNIDLKYDNLLLNLEGGKDYVLKTEETGTKFNFTIMPLFQVQSTTEFTTTVNIGCNHDGNFYEVGKEFQIGCEELCECTGQDTQECAKLECPALVGIELISKGCVKWAPAPKPHPPNCCPRTARCLSDGTCHYKEHAVPNWSEVPISLTGCEQRCFCENGELDCQEICTPLPPVPPQTLRCLPGQRPTPVNISDDDCCKKWACKGGAGINGSQQSSTERMYTGLGYNNGYVTAFDVIESTTTSVLVEPPTTTDYNIDSLPYINPSKISTTEKIKGSNSDQVQLDNVNSVIRHFYPQNLEYAFSVKALPPKNPHIDDNKAKVGNLYPVNGFKDYPYLQGYKNRPSSLHLNTNYKELAPENYVLSNNIMYSASNVANAPNNNNAFVSHDVMPLLHNYNTDNQPSYAKGLTDYHPVPNFNTQSMSKKPQEPMHSLEEQYFKPTFTNLTRNFIFPKPLAPQHLYSSQSNSREQFLEPPPKKMATVLYNKDQIISLTSNTTKYNQPYWSWNKNFMNPSQFFTKDTDPSDTIQLTPVLTNRYDSTKYHNRPDNLGQANSFSAMDLENVLNQLEVETELGRNIGRSVEKASVKRPKAEIANPNEFEKPNKPPPSFLPTIPPDMYPHEDYNHNHIPLPVRPHEPLLPPGLPFVPNYGQHDNKFNVLSIQPESSTSVKMLFALPSYLVGLKGYVDLRYTDKKDNDVSRWFSQIFAPPDEILSTPRLEFRLAGLNASTTYRIKGKLVIDNLPVDTESEVYTVRTLDAPIVEEKTRDINSKLTVVDVNDTTAHITWRHFTEDELRFIDGIQVRYRPVGTPIYSMTELLHHSRSVAELKDLHPGSRYEASLVLIPPPRASTELHDPTRLEFKTAPYIDPYNWSVTVEARKVGSEAAELSWRGIPSPAERWVRVYRAAHECGSGRTMEHDTFRLASRDQPPTITLAGLEPNTRCRVWLELFLTNGKVKTSNVLEVFTKSADSPETIDNVIEASSVSAGREGGTRGDYYGALVVVGVVAALGALTSLLLLLIVVRRHRPHSVPITSVPTAPRESSLPPYDNPAYKLELQQETVDL